MAVLSVIVLSFAGCCITCSNCQQQAKYKKTIHVQSPFSAGSTVKARTNYGSITANGDAVNDCNVTADICVQAPTEQEAAQIAEQIKIQLVPDGNTMTIKAEKPEIKKNRCINIAYKITVPNRTSIECKSSYGNIKLNNLNGYNMARTSYGNIECIDIDGMIELDTSYGNISCKGIISNDLDVRSSYGDINIEYSQKASNQVVADASTSYGKIDFTTPQNFAGQVEFETGHGSITTELPITVKGKISTKRIEGNIGQGSGKLSLRTSFGSIKIK